MGKEVVEPNKLKRSRLGGKFTGRSSMAGFGYMGGRYVLYVCEGGGYWIIVKYYTIYGN